MATNVDKEILVFEIEAGDALTEQEKLKQLFIDSKESYKQLQKAYKDGAITQREFAQESVRLENNQKKLGAAYSDIQRKVTGLKNPIKELTESNKKLSDQFQTLGSNINVGGVSLAGLSTKMAQFATPAGLALGIVTALGTAYAQSSEGAKDLEFAQHELAGAFQLASDALGDLVNTGKDGEGFFTRLLESTVSVLSFGASDFFTKQAHAAALGIEMLQDKERELTRLKAAGQDRLQDNADLLTKISLSQTSYNEKVKALGEIEANLEKNRAGQIGNLTEQIKILEGQKATTKDKEGLEGKINDKLLERSQLEKGINRLMEANNRLASNLADAEEKAAEAVRKKLRFTPGSAESSSDGSELADPLDAQEQAQDAGVESRQANLDLLAEMDAEYLANKADTEGGYQEQSLSREQFLAQNKTKIQGLQAQQAANILGASAKLAGAIFGKQTAIYKVIASSQALVQTYLGATEAFTSLAGIPYVGPILGGIAAAAAVVSGLANVAAINNVKLGGETFAEGGFTGSGGKYQVAGVVHRGEYVVPKWQVENPAYSGHIAAIDAGRYRGYADGGIVAASATAKFDQQVSFMDMIAKVPAPKLVYSEFNTFTNRVAQKVALTEI